MQSLLQPGIIAPDFRLPAANADGSVSVTEHRGTWIILLFLPEALTEELAEQLSQLQQRMGPQATSPAVAIGISDASSEALREFAAARGIQFALASDSGGDVGKRSVHEPRTAN